ncbi:K Homology domain-containing protein [Caenorhabditis elegans]|uniref:K Homology domain-containing protein n=1 Tax=Caenorhabditis elegans TaxID=6239 RepID=A0A8D9IA45_CAEEL|nr:K Homology domain-containing protein [Caenorhabditis elegans]CAG8860230.1 K Homology domain-containing protein [Caenorhabditis elegans]
MDSEILNYPIHRFLDSSLLGQFIGPEGSNIYKIEKYNKVALDIWKNDEENSNVRITGPYWNLKSALNDVLELVSTIRNKNQRYKFEMPSKDIGFLIGKNGAKINEIKLSSNVDVHFERNNENRDNGETDGRVVVSVTGNYQQILIGLRLIYDRLTSKGQKTLYEDPRTRQFAESLMESLD